MRFVQLLFSLLLLFPAWSCNSNKAHSKSEKKSIDPLENARFITSNFRVVDTVFLKGNTDRIIFKDALIKDSLAIVSYALFSFDDSRTVDLSEVFKEHYIALMAQDQLPEVNGELIDPTTLNFLAKPFALGRGIGHFMGVKVDLLDAPNVPEEAHYVLARKLDYHDYRFNMLLKLAQKEFDLLFEMGPTFDPPVFEAQGDTAITYSYSTSEAYKRFAYDFKNELVLLDSTLYKD